MEPPSIDTVRRLIDRQFPQWSCEEIAPVSGSGTDHAMFRLGKRMAVRLPRNNKAARQILREQAWLPRFTGLPLAIPVVHRAGTADAAYPLPWTVFDWIDGRDATSARITDWQATAIALGSFVASLRQCDAQGAPVAGRDNAWRGAPLSILDRVARKSMRALADLYDPRSLVEIWETALSEPLWTAAPVWVHGDLHAGNLIVCDGRLTGVVDFGLMGAGDPACDLAPAWSFLPASARDRFREAAMVDDATWARGKGWGLYIGVIALSFYRDRNPVLAQVARTAIAALFEDRTL